MICTASCGRACFQERTIMSRYIYKYEFQANNYLEVVLPEGAEILYVGNQRGVVCLWALVDLAKPLERRKFRLAGTGHEITEEVVKYTGTVMLHDARLVFHVFEV